MQIHECSPEAKAQISSFEDKIGLRPYVRGKNKYPWERMEIGQCFVEKFEEDRKEQERRLKGLIANKKYLRKKEFVLITHFDHKLFEVARIA